jgi:glucose-6-phosphate isomerase
MRIQLPEDVKTSIDKTIDFGIPNFVQNMDNFLEIAKDLKKRVPSILGSYEHLGIVGIGGSQVQPLVFSPHKTVSVTHLEVPDPYILKQLPKNSENTRILYISRSGTTKEVLSFVPYLMKYKSLAVTNGGFLIEIAKKLGWDILKVSYDVSGRFAIQNELGIVPMIAMGLDPEIFLSNLKQSYDENFKEGSLADKTATQIFNLEKKDIAKARILTSGIYPQGLGILLLQLLNESAPKKKTDKIDASLHFMPRGAHSDLQRWYGGVKDSFVISLRCDTYEKDMIPPSNDLGDLVPGSTISAAENLNITSKAVEDTFPGAVFRIIAEKDTIDETAKVIGFLHALTVRLCQLKGSNPFNQPAVQKYKERATEIYQELLKQ